MELQPRGAPLPPLFAALRRRDPDVDIVLLPPEEPRSDAPGGPVDDAALAAATVRTSSDLARFWRVAVPGEEPPEPGFGFGPDPASVVARARASTTLTGSPFAALAAVFADDGWQVVELPGAVPRLIGRRGDTELTASYAAPTGAFVLTAISTPLRVGADRARALVRR